MTTMTAEEEMLIAKILEEVKDPAPAAETPSEPVTEKRSSRRRGAWTPSWRERSSSRVRVRGAAFRLP
jgi:hypothetical protein